jgi:hypothetical protein
MHKKKILIGLRNVEHLEYIENILNQFNALDYEVSFGLDPNFLISNSINETKIWMQKNYELVVNEFFCLKKSPNSVKAKKEVLSCVIYLNDATVEWPYFRRHLSRSSVNLRYFSKLILLSILPKFARIKFSVKFTEKLRKSMVSDEVVNKEILRINPDLILITPGNMFNSYEDQLIVDAKSVGIPTVVHALSWDNLNNKGTVMAIPDKYFVWNNMHKELLIRRHRIPLEVIEVLGSSFFERYFQNQKYFLKTEVCEALSIPPNSNILTYLGSSKNVCKSENLGLEKLLLESEHLEKNYFIIIRPHPANYRIWDNWRFPNTLVWPRFQNLESRSALETLSILKASKGAFGINTSGFIDAIASRTPVFGINFDNIIFQENTSHFQALKKEGLPVFNSIDDAISSIESGNLQLMTNNIALNLLPNQGEVVTRSIKIINKLIANSGRSIND